MTAAPPLVRLARPVSHCRPTPCGFKASCTCWTRLHRKKQSQRSLPQSQVLQAQASARGLTIRSSRDRFVAASMCGTLSHRRGHKSVRLNSGVRSSWRKTLKLVNRAYLRASCGCDVGHRERLAPLSRSTFLAALTGHPRQAAVALPSLATRKVMGQSRPNNSFKPTPLRGAA